MKLISQPSGDQSKHEPQETHYIHSVECPHDDLDAEEAVEMAFRLLCSMGYNPDTIHKYFVEYTR